MMTNHQHIQMLVDRIDGERTSGIGGGRQDVRFSTYFDDVRSVPPSRPFRMKGMDGPAFERTHRILHEPGLVQGIGMNRDLGVHFVGDSKTNVNRSRSRAPILASFNPMAPPEPVRANASGFEEFPLPRNPRFIGNSSAACNIFPIFHAPGVQVVAFVPVAGRYRLPSSWSLHSREPPQSAGDR